MSDFAKLRERMVREQIAERGIRHSALLAAMRAVPRHIFVAPELSSRAYEDHPLPIEAKQTISQPYIVAMMIEAADVNAGDRVLEVGAGSGYAAAILGLIAREVVAIERHQELARLARERMRMLGYGNVSIVHGDGTRGWPEAAPYDAILAAAAAIQVPQPLVEQLAPGGRLVLPVGPHGGIQQLVRVTRASDGRVVTEELGAVRFVPLIGDEGDV